MNTVFDRIAVVLSCLILAGCGPGWITWAEGTDVLRTAIVAEARVGDQTVASIFLSNGSFTCAQPARDDPNDMTQALTGLQNAACREGARHVFVRLFRETGSDWTGRYHGVDQVGEGSPTEHVAEASYYAVEEAFLVETPLLARAYAAAEEERVLEAAAGGTVEITRDGERMVGSFQFPDAALQGSFRARWCGADTSLLALLAPVPFHLCTP